MPFSGDEDRDVLQGVPVEDDPGGPDVLLGRPVQHLQLRGVPPVRRGQRDREGDGDRPGLPPSIGLLLPPEAPVGRPVRRRCGGGPGGDRRFRRPSDRQGGPRLGARRRRAGEGEQRLLPPPFRASDRPAGGPRRRGDQGGQPEGGCGALDRKRRPVRRRVDLLDAAEGGRGEGSVPRDRRSEVVRERGRTAAEGLLFRSGDAGDGRRGSAQGYQHPVERRAMGKDRQPILRVMAGGAPW